MDIHIHGDAYGRHYDYKCLFIECKPSKIKLHTMGDSVHEIILSAKHTVCPWSVLLPMMVELSLQTLYLIENLLPSGYSEKKEV